MDRIAVAIRLRPLLDSERGLAISFSRVGTDRVLQRIGSNNGGSRRNSFNGAAPSGKAQGEEIKMHCADVTFGAEHSNVAVFDHFCAPLVDKTMQGYNSTIFAYGQTGSGKTYSMSGTAEDPGIVPMMVVSLFGKAQQAQDRNYKFTLSGLEVYNEQINDLLVPDGSNLRIADHEGSCVIDGLTTVAVTSASDVLRHLQTISANRVSRATLQNDHSSRSHTVVRLLVESRARAVASPPLSASASSSDLAALGEEPSRASAPSSATAAAPAATGKVTFATVTLVDLAGSEGMVRAGNEGSNLAEGKHINRSLLTLGKIMRMLANRQAAGGHIPFRESKLTRILQASLEGSALINLLATISPLAASEAESESTLSFAAEAKRVALNASVNEFLPEAEQIKRLQAQVQQLQQQLVLAKSAPLPPAPVAVHASPALPALATTPAMKVLAAKGVLGILTSHPLSSVKGAESTPTQSLGPSPVGSPMRRYTDDTVAQADSMSARRGAAPMTLNFDGTPPPPPQQQPHDAPGDESVEMLLSSTGMTLRTVLPELGIGPPVPHGPTEQGTNAFGSPMANQLDGAQMALASTKLEGAAADAGTVAPVPRQAAGVAAVAQLPVSAAMQPPAAGSTLLTSWLHSPDARGSISSIARASMASVNMGPAGTCGRGHAAAHCRPHLPRPSKGFVRDGFSPANQGSTIRRYTQDDDASSLASYGSNHTTSTVSTTPASIRNQAKLQQQVQQAESRVKRLEAELSELRVQDVRTRDTLKEARAQEGTLKAELTRALKQLEQANKKVSQAEAELEKQRARHLSDKEVVAARQAADKAQRDKDAAKAQARATGPAAAVADYQRQQQVVQDAVARERELSEERMRGAAAASASMLQQLEAANARTAELEGLLASEVGARSRAETHSLQQDAKAEGLADQLQRTQVQLAEAQDQVSSLQGQLAATVAQIPQVSVVELQEALRSAAQVQDGLRAELEGVREEAKRHKSELWARGLKIEHLEHKVGELSEEVKGLKQQLADKRIPKMFESANAKLEAEVQILRAQLAASEQVQRELEVQVARTRAGTWLNERTGSPGAGPIGPPASPPPSHSTHSFVAVRSPAAASRAAATGVPVSPGARSPGPSVRSGAGSSAGSPGAHSASGGHSPTAAADRPSPTSSAGSTAGSVSKLVRNFNATASAAGAGAGAVSRILRGPGASGEKPPSPSVSAPRQMLGHVAAPMSHYSPTHTAGISASEKYSLRKSPSSAGGAASAGSAGSSSGSSGGGSLATSAAGGAARSKAGTAVSAALAVSAASTGTAAPHRRVSGIPTRPGVAGGAQATWRPMYKPTADVASGGSKSAAVRGATISPAVSTATSTAVAAAGVQAEAASLTPQSSEVERPDTQTSTCTQAQGGAPDVQPIPCALNVLCAMTPAKTSAAPQTVQVPAHALCFTPGTISTEEWTALESPEGQPAAAADAVTVADNHPPLLQGFESPVKQGRQQQLQEQQESETWSSPCSHLSSEDAGAAGEGVGAAQAQSPGPLMPGQPAGQTSGHTGQTQSQGASSSASSPSSFDVPLMLPVSSLGPGALPSLSATAGSVHVVPPLALTPKGSLLLDEDSGVLLDLDDQDDSLLPAGLMGGGSPDQQGASQQAHPPVRLSVDLAHLACDTERGVAVGVWARPGLGIGARGH